MNASPHPVFMGFVSIRKMDLGASVNQVSGLRYRQFKKSYNILRTLIQTGYSLRLAVSPLKLNHLRNRKSISRVTKTATHNSY